MSKGRDPFQKSCYYEAYTFTPFCVDVQLFSNQHAIDRQDIGGVQAFFKAFCPSTHHFEKFGIGGGQLMAGTLGPEGEIHQRAMHLGLREVRRAVDLEYVPWLRVEAHLDVHGTVIRSPRGCCCQAQGYLILKSTTVLIGQ